MDPPISHFSLSLSAAIHLLPSTWNSSLEAIAVDPGVVYLLIPPASEPINPTSSLREKTRESITVLFSDICCTLEHTRTSNFSSCFLLLLPQRRFMWRFFFLPEKLVWKTEFRVILICPGGRRNKSKSHSNWPCNQRHWEHIFCQGDGTKIQKKGLNG